jgi:hypothetical protein
MNKTIEESLIEYMDKVGEQSKRIVHIENALRRVCKATEADEDNIYLPLTGLQAKHIFDDAHKALNEKH